MLIVLNPGNLAKALLGNFDLWPEPERITEVYFTNPDKLPSSFTPGQPLSIDFTVHNIEFETTTYTYEIQQTAASVSSARTLAKGTITLEHEADRAQTIPIQLADIPAKSQITVRVTRVETAEQPAAAYSISHWITNAQRSLNE